MHRIQTSPLIICLYLAAMCSAASAQPATQRPPEQNPDATLTLSGGLIGAGIGYSWGRGVLSYQGQALAFCVRGIALGEIGAGNVKADGKVFNLKSIDEFAGDYL